MLNRIVYCENDANCFTLSESIDGSAKHYKVVFGIILGSGCGGGLVIDKKVAGHFEPEEPATVARALALYVCRCCTF